MLTRPATTTAARTGQRKRWNGVRSSHWALERARHFFLAMTLLRNFLYHCCSTQISTEAPPKGYRDRQLRAVSGRPAARFGSRRSPLSQVHWTCLRAFGAPRLTLLDPRQHALAGQDPVAVGDID